MGAIPFDLRDALTSLRRDRSYTATVILTLALTIGATTAVFSIVDGVLLKPLAYRESQRLVALNEVWRQFPHFSRLEVNEQHFEYWRAHSASFASMAQYVVIPANLTGAGDAAQIALVHASGSLFDVLQTSPALGRALTPDDEREDRPAAIVITDALWRQRFGADPAVVGRPVGVDGRSHVVVGVLPAEFRLPLGEQLSAKIDGFVPIRMAAERVGWVGDHNNAAIGRLKPDVTPDRARAELDVLQAQVSEIATQQAHEPVTLASTVTPLAEAIVGRSRQGLMLLLGAIAAVLLIACSNLANLGLTRTVGRLREAAIRSALGASGARLVGRALLEQLLLSGAGGALGVWVAWLALSAFVRTAPIDVPRANEVGLDARVLAFAAAVSVLTGLLVAVLPAWRIAGRDVQGALRAGGSGTTGDRGGQRTRAALLAFQVALSVTLLVVTALLSVSFMRLLNVDRGFSADRVLAIGVSLPATRYADETARLAVYDRMLADLHALPGVDAAATTSMLPLSGQGQVNAVAPEGNTRPFVELPSANFRFVSPDYFRALGLTIRRGRAFTSGERAPDRPAPALVSEPVAARLWPGQDPIGKRFSRGNADEQGFEVVGVAADARLTSIERTPPLMVYVPYWWRSRASTSLLIKTPSDPDALVASVRRVVHRIDPEIAVGDTRPLERLVDAAMAGRRYQMQLFAAFGAVALLIAAIGVYAVTSHGVARRRREMNIRVALGARRSQVLGLILRQGTAPIAAGAAGGVAGALALGGVVASLLFDVRARDPLIIAAVVALVGGVGVATSAVAARQGLRINPASALREE
jgi:putative ABC transport system permease protein